MFWPNAAIGNYNLIRLIGSGSFATVWLGQHKVTGLNVAVKVINKQTLTTPDSSNRFFREIALLKQMDHPFIAELYEIIETQENYFLVMEYVENGNMLNFVNVQGNLDENRSRRYFCQLVSALNYLHNQKFIAHRDLKAENILLDKHDNIRLIDFGLSNGFSKQEPILKTACGSPAYAAPEMIKGCPYTKAADIWSAGVVLYAMVAGCLPFDDANVQTLLQKVVYTEVTYPSSMSRSLIDLLKRLLVKNPEKRLTIAQIIAHPWFTQCEYASIMDFNFMSLYEHINKNVVEQMKQMKCDVTSLTQSILLGDYNDITSIYRQLKKNELTETVDHIINKLSSTHSERTSPFPQLMAIHVMPQNILPKPDSMMTLALHRSSYSEPATEVTPRRLSRPVVLKKPKMSIQGTNFPPEGHQYMIPLPIPIPTA